MCTIGEKLVYLRKKAGLTQEKVAQSIHLERSTYAHYEIGTSTPKAEILLLLSRLFGVTADFLIDDNQPIPTE